MPMNENQNSAHITDNQAIYNVLSKILIKWREDPQSSFPGEKTQFVDSSSETNQINKESVCLLDDQIIQETVILRPEDFLAEFDAPSTPSENEIPETRCVPLEKGEGSETPEPIQQIAEDVPKTIVQTLDASNKASSQKAGTKDHIPETVIFSPQGISDTNTRPQPQERGSSHPINTQQANEGSDIVKHNHDHVPETIIFKNKKNKKARP